MMKLIRLVFLAALLVFFASTILRGQEETASKMPKHLNQILNWLPADSETLIVANGPFDLPARPSKVLPFIDSIRSLPVGLVTRFQDGLLANQLHGTKVSIAVEASRRFTSPKGLGMMPFEGCQILKFDIADQSVVQATVDLCFERAHKILQLGDTKAATFIEKWENDEWTLMVAQLQPGILVCATNEQFLTEIIERSKVENLDRAFPDSLPEWQHFNRNSSVWGMRHYRKEFAEADPSSPLRSRSAANSPDSQAIGFVFWFDDEPENAARARYLSGAKEAAQIVSRIWHNTAEKLTPTINTIQPGVVEITANVSGSDDKGGRMFLFVLLAYLGHAVYL